MTNMRIASFALMRSNGFLQPNCTDSISKRTIKDNKREKKEYYARKLVGFSREQMFDVVADVNNYKFFVPFCKKSTILSQGYQSLTAELQIGFPPIFESYISEVSLKRPSMVKAICKDGRLFHYLETCWRFNPGVRSNPRSSIVDFSIDFEFKSMVHYQLANMFFEALVRQMETAFIVEAKKRYGLESVPMHKLSYMKS